jgi:hypothetical protein
VTNARALCSAQLFTAVKKFMMSAPEINGLKTERQEGVNYINFFFTKIIYIFSTDKSRLVVAAQW